MEVQGQKDTYGVHATEKLKIDKSAIELLHQNQSNILSSCNIHKIAMVSYCLSHSDAYCLVCQEEDTCNHKNCERIPNLTKFIADVQVKADKYMTILQELAVSFDKVTKKSIWIKKVSTYQVEAYFNAILTQSQYIQFHLSPQEVDNTQEFPYLYAINNQLFKYGDQLQNAMAVRDLNVLHDCKCDIESHQDIATVMRDLLQSSLSITNGEDQLQFRQKVNNLLKDNEKLRVHFYEVIAQQFMVDVDWWPLKKNTHEEVKTEKGETLKHIVDEAGEIQKCFYLRRRLDQRWLNAKISGSFDNWSAQHPMDYDSAYCTFTKWLPLKKGQKYYYKFVINGQYWVWNHLEPLETDENGNTNNVLII